jgi:hypothetical protein
MKGYRTESKKWNTHDISCLTVNAIKNGKETSLIKFPSISFISQTCNNLYQKKRFLQFWVYKVYNGTCKSSFNKVYKVTLTKFSVKLNLECYCKSFLYTVSLRTLVNLLVILSLWELSQIFFIFRSVLADLLFNF